MFVVGNQDLLEVFLELLRGNILKVLQNLLRGKSSQGVARSSQRWT
jgi:hypothetical protein